MSISTARSTAIPEFAGETIDDVTIKRLLPGRDNWGGCLWDVECKKCGKTLVLGTRQIKQRIRTSCHRHLCIEEVEEASGCVTPERGGCPLSTFRSYLAARRLKEGQLDENGELRLKEGQLDENGKYPEADYFQKWVKESSAVRTFFCRQDSLDRCKAEGKAARKRKGRERHAESEVTWQRGEPYVRWSFAQYYLRLPDEVAGPIYRELCERTSGRDEQRVAYLADTDKAKVQGAPFSKSALQDWENRGWPLLQGKTKSTPSERARKRKANGKCPDRVESQGHRYFALEEIEKARRTFNSLPSCIPANHPTLYGLDKTSALIGITPGHLKNIKVTQVLDLKRELFTVKLEFKNSKGRSVTLIKDILCFTKESVHTYLITKAELALPDSAIRLQVAARFLRKASARSTITARALNDWCRERLLDSLKTRFMTKTGKHKGWIIANDSYDKLREILLSTGWDIAAATVKLRALRDELIKDNGGQPPDSDLESDLKEARKSAQKAAIEQVKVLKQSVETFPALGIEVNFAKKTVCCPGHKIDFERSEVQWHIFKVALAAHPDAYSLADLIHDYPTDNSDVDSRKSAITDLNKKLKRVGLRLEDRTLSLLRTNT